VSEIGELLIVYEVVDVFLIAMAHAHHVGGHRARLLVARLDVALEITTIAPDHVAQARQRREQFEDGFELLRLDQVAKLEIAQLHVLRAELDEDAIQRRIVLHVFFALAPLHLIERRLRNVDIAVPHELGHLAAKEREQQGADV
jgi:hypothetical protein